VFDFILIEIKIYLIYEKILILNYV